MKGKAVDEVTAARIRKAAREGRVEIAPRDKIADHRQQVDRILRDIGFSEALVTDESCFSDFPLGDTDYGRLSRQYAFEVSRRDRIAAVAERLAGLRCRNNWVEEHSLERPLKIDNDFTPCPVAAGDELFPNGIFVFNITKIIEYIQRNPDSVALEEVAVRDFSQAFSSINESHVESVEISKPVILAEISPGRYNLIDGQHRMEKARRMGIKSVRAYKLNVHQHMRFLISEKAYVAYIGYWNSKLKGMGKIGRSHNKKNRRTKNST